MTCELKHMFNTINHLKKHIIVTLSSDPVREKLHQKLEIIRDRNLWKNSDISGTIRQILHFREFIGIDY
jgi:hypothetical protein